MKNFSPKNISPQKFKIIQGVLDLVGIYLRIKLFGTVKKISFLYFNILVTRCALFGTVTVPNNIGCATANDEINIYRNQYCFHNQNLVTKILAPH